MMPQENIILDGLAAWWMQDHVEIGYSERPFGPVVKIALVCPYTDELGNPTLSQWPYAQQMGAFSLGNILDGSVNAGNFGGNIELSNPQEGHPLGRILCGMTISSTLTEFLDAQEKQDLYSVDLSFADVQHIDEVISPGPDGKTYMTNPDAAITLLETNFQTSEDQLAGVFFSKDGVRAKVTTAFVNTPLTPTVEDPDMSSNRYIITSLDYDSAIAEWGTYGSGYVRVVGPNASGGQVAKITGFAKAIATDAPGAGVVGKLKVIVGQVWVAPVDTDWSKEYIDCVCYWPHGPKEDDNLVFVKDTLRWKPGGIWSDVEQTCVPIGVPAFITVKEILESNDFLNYNHNLVPLIAASVDPAIQPIGLPCLYFYATDAPGLGRTSYAGALIPAAINLQWTAGGVAAVAMQFGPRNAADEDVFEKNLRTILGANTVFMDDWFSFHLNRGEVHCGSAAKRTPEPSWWTK